jgi:group I intron endonuclease
MEKNLKNLKILSIVPIAVYINAEELLEKKIILGENREKSGVYCWLNIINDKCYVGSSVVLSKRLIMYYQDSFIAKELLRGNSKIYRALAKYGHSNFKLVILEYCDPKDIIKREQYYLDLLEPEYNILKIAGSPHGRKHTEETLAKMRKRRHSDLVLAKMRIAATGRKFSEDTLKKLSDAKIGEKNPMFGKTHSEVHYSVSKKIGIAMGAKVVVTNVETNEVVEYFSMREASRELKTSNFTVGRYITSEKLL